MAEIWIVTRHYGLGQDRGHEMVAAATSYNRGCKFMLQMHRDFPDRDYTIEPVDVLSEEADNAD